MRILAIDDDPTILEIIELFLESLGYSDIHVAPSADHAIRQMDRHTAAFDLVLLDVNMPGMSGISLIRQIVDHPLHKTARIVMLSALGDARHIEDAFIAGAFDYIVKPFELPALEASIRTVEKLARAGTDGDDFPPGWAQPVAVENCILRVPSAALTVLSITPPQENDRDEMHAAIHSALADWRCMMTDTGGGGLAVLSFGSESSARDIGRAAEAAFADVCRSDAQSAAPRIDTEILRCTRERGGPEMRALLWSKSARDATEKDR